MTPNIETPSGRTELHVELQKLSVMQQASLLFFLFGRLEGRLESWVPEVAPQKPGARAALEDLVKAVEITKAGGTARDLVAAGREAGQ